MNMIHIKKFFDNTKFDDTDEDINDRIDFGIRNDLHDVPGNVDLSIELEHKIRTEPDGSTLTVNDFLSQFGIEESEMTGFAWGAILKNAQKYKDMPDVEFFKMYNNYKSKIVTERYSQEKLNENKLSEKILKKLIKTKDLYLIKYKVINKEDKSKSNVYEYILVSQNKHEAKHDFKRMWGKGAKKSKLELDIISVTIQTEFGKGLSKGSFKNKLMYS